MATDDVLKAAVERAVNTAMVDVDAPQEEQCMFDRAALDAVLRLCDSELNSSRVMAAVDTALSTAIEQLDGDRTVAATTLRLRIDAGAYQHVIPVENLQGDVGAG